MWKIISMCLLFGLNSAFFSQSMNLTPVKIENIDGMYMLFDVNYKEEQQKYLQFLKKFEKKFSENYKEFPEAYRYYTIGRLKPEILEVDLYPKKEYPKGKDFYSYELPPNTTIFKITYDVNTEEISKPFETKVGIVK